MCAREHWTRRLLPPSPRLRRPLRLIWPRRPSESAGCGTVSLPGFGRPYRTRCSVGHPGTVGCPATPTLLFLVAREILCCSFSISQALSHPPVRHVQQGCPVPPTSSWPWGWTKILPVVLNASPWGTAQQIPTSMPCLRRCPKLVHGLVKQAWPVMNPASRQRQRERGAALRSSKKGRSNRG